jgi:hypothetical protein
VSAAPPSSASPPFADAHGCKEWLNALPLTNIPHAQGVALEALRALNAAAVEGLERLKCLELLRDKVAFLQREQRSRYFGKTLPLSAADAAAWNTGRLLLEEMESGYRQALEAARASAELQRHAALAGQRIARSIGAQMMFHAAVYRRFDPQLWSRLHRAYAEAEEAGVAEERVKDSLESDDGASSMAEAYAHVVLAQAAYLSELTAPQMEYVEALLRMWARKAHVRRASSEGTLPPALHPLVVDFEKPIGARPLAPRDVTPHHRIVEVEALSLSLRRRIQALRLDQDPVALKLPPNASAGEALHALQRLHRLWCEGAPVRPPGKVPEENSASVAFGLPEAYYFLAGGKAFEQPDRSRELTRQEKQDIEVFGQVTSRTQSMMAPAPSFSVEAWGVVDEMMGAWRLLRPATASRGVAIGRLVVMRLAPSAPFFLGMVSALTQETDGRIVITVTLFPGRAEPLAVRAADPSRARGEWHPGFRLPALEKLRIPASLVLPNGIAAPKRGVETWEEGARPAVVTEVLDRGSDFERVRLD